MYTTHTQKTHKIVHSRNFFLLQHYKKLHAATLKFEKGMFIWNVTAMNKDQIPNYKNVRYCNKGENTNDIIYVV